MLCKKICYKGMVLPGYFKSLSLTKSVMVRRRKPAQQPLVVHIPLLLGCRFFNGKILQTTKPWESSYLPKEEWVTVFTLQPAMWKTRSYKRSQRSCLLATYFLCSSDKGEAICGTSNEAVMTKRFQKDIWRVPNTLDKKASEQEESYSSLCNLYSAAKCTSL